MGTFHKVAATKSLSPGQGIAVEVGANKIALFNVAGIFYAIGDTCTHREGHVDRRAEMLTSGRHRDDHISES